MLAPTAATIGAAMASPASVRFKTVRQDSPSAVLDNRGKAGFLTPYFTSSRSRYRPANASASAVEEGFRP
jgi:hypothetical protein